MRKLISLMTSLGLVMALAQTFWGQEVRQTQPFEGVKFIHRQDDAPRPVEMWLVKIDLSAPGIGFRVTEPNGDQPGETNAETTLGYVRRVGAQIGINSNLFQKTKEGLLPTVLPYLCAAGLKLGVQDNLACGRMHTNVLSLAASDGSVYSPWEQAFFSGINISRDNVATLIRGSTGTTQTQPPVPLYNAVAGYLQIVRGGVYSAGPYGHRGGADARTAIALTRDRHLLLFVVDGGRQDSQGLTAAEVASVLIKYGAEDAVILDGGSSTTLALCVTPNTCRVVNRPSDGLALPVGNNLAVFAQRRPLR